MEPTSPIVYEEQNNLDCTNQRNLVIVPYWVQEEQLSAQKSDGWESVIDMSLDVYRPNVVQGGDDRPVLVSSGQEGGKFNPLL